MLPVKSFEGKNNLLFLQKNNFSYLKLKQRPKNPLTLRIERYHHFRIILLRLKRYGMQIFELTKVFQ
jgi:hypothetical protein